MKYLETDKSFYKKLLTIALPVALQNVITTGVNLVDTVMLGKLGETALSSSSLANHFIALYQYLCMGIGMGASVLTSRYWGAKNLASLKKSITVAIRVGLLTACAFTVVNVLFPRQILGLYSSESHVVEAGASYLEWSAATYFLMALSLILTNIMRSVDLSKIPFAASLAAFAVNVGANYVFIYGKFGAPRMGVAGAALGTVIARVVETGVIAGYFFFTDKSIGYRLKDLLSSCRDMVREFVRVSIPVVISDGLLGIGDNVLAMIMGHIGEQFVSANAITAVVSRISTIFISGIAFASCFITGQTLGTGSVQKAKKQGYTFLLLGGAIGCVASLIIFLIRMPIVGAYDIMDSTKEIALQLLDAISLIVIFRSINTILTKGVLRGGGDTRFLMAADTAALWVVSIPLGAVAGLWWHLPPFWTFVCLYSDQIIKAFWCIFRLKSGKWVKRIQGVAFEEDPLPQEKHKTALENK